MNIVENNNTISNLKNNLTNQHNIKFKINFGHHHFKFMFIELSRQIYDDLQQISMNDQLIKFDYYKHADDVNGIVIALKKNISENIEFALFFLPKNISITKNINIYFLGDKIHFSRLNMTEKSKTILNNQIIRDIFDSFNRQFTHVDDSEICYSTHSSESISCYDEEITCSESRKTDTCKRSSCNADTSICKRRNECCTTTEYPDYKPTKFGHNDRLDEIEKLNDKCVKKINVSKNNRRKHK